MLSKDKIYAVTVNHSKTTTNLNCYVKVQAGSQPLVNILMKCCFVNPWVQGALEWFMSASQHYLLIIIRLIIYTWASWGPTGGSAIEECAYVTGKIFKGLCFGLPAAAVCFTPFFPDYLCPLLMNIEPNTMTFATIYHFQHPFIHSILLCPALAAQKHQ